MVQIRLSWQFLFPDYEYIYLTLSMSVTICFQYCHTDVVSNIMPVFEEKKIFHNLSNSKENDLFDTSFSYAFVLIKRYWKIDLVFYSCAEEISKRSFYFNKNLVVFKKLLIRIYSNYTLHIHNIPESN